MSTSLKISLGYALESHGDYNPKKSFDSNGSNESEAPRALDPDIFAFNPTTSAPSVPDQYFLNVFINGIDQEIIANFRRMPNGQFAIEKKELEELGLKSHSAGESKGSSLIFLEKLPGVSLRYDEASQSIDLFFPDSLRVPQILEGTYKQDLVPMTPSATGASLNYTFFASQREPFFFPNEVTLKNNRPTLSSFGDFEIFAPLGNLSNTFIAKLAGPIDRANTFNEVNRFIRLDSTATYRNREDMYTINGGDFISGSLWWTRPVRLGGFQIQRDFSLQPNFLTLPLPEFSGSASLPSTLEIYSQNVQVFSSPVKPGPFSIQNIPQLTSSSGFNVVMRDSLGREVTTSVPFYTAATLLIPGLMSYSLDVGYPRQLFGVDSWSYTNTLMGSASLRRGIINSLTLEGHAEGGGQLINGGIGIITRAGPLGTISLAGGGSSFGIQKGQFLNLSYEVYSTYFSLFFTSRRNFGAYNDIGSVSDKFFINSRFPPNVTSNWENWFAQNKSHLQSSEQISFAVPLRLLGSNLTLAFARTRYTDGQKSRFLNVSYNMALFTGNLAVSGFFDLKHRNKGVYATYSMLFGDRLWGSATGGSNSSGYGFDLVKNKIGDDIWTWRLTDREGPSPYRLAQAQVDTRVGSFAGSVQTFGRNMSVNAQTSGAVVFMDNAVVMGAPITGSFAMVDAGAPGVHVKQNNNYIGKTNRQGRILVPNLSPYLNNKIEIDPTTLPVDRMIEQTELVVVPPPATGISLSFGDTSPHQALLVQFVAPGNHVLPLGSSGTFDSQSEEFIIGHDGQAYIFGLKAPVTIRITNPNGICRATIEELPSSQPIGTFFGPIICTPE